MELPVFVDLTSQTPPKIRSQRPLLAMENLVRSQSRAKGSSSSSPMTLKIAEPVVSPSGDDRSDSIVRAVTRPIRANGKFNPFRKV